MSKPTPDNDADTVRTIDVVPLLVPIEEAARVLAVGRSTLYELIAAGELETVHIGRCRRVPVESLRKFVARRASRHE